MASIDDAERQYYRLSPGNLLGDGRLFYFRDRQSVASGASHIIAFTTESKAVVLKNILIQFTGTNEMRVDAYTGGTVTGGTTIEDIFPSNHYQPKESPYVADSVLSDVTVTVPGTLFQSVGILQTDRNDLAASAGGGIILRPDTLYYLDIQNAGNQTAELDISVTAAQID